MAATDHYLLTMRGRAITSGTSIQNAFVYFQQEGAGTAVRLNEGFVATIVPLIVGVLSTEYNLDDLLTINLDDPADYDTMVVNEPGTQGGEFLPIYNSFSFEYVRTTRAIQNGRKAFSVIGEANVANGVPNAPTLASLNNLALALGGEVPDAISSSSWRPQLWRRPGTYAAGVVSAPGLFYEIDSVRYVRVSTQNTRKIGRGS